MMISVTFLWLLLVIPGTVLVVIFSYHSVIDYQLLTAAYQNFAAVINSTNDLLSVIKADAQQNIHRINLFADGTWTLLSGIWAAIGLVGVFLLKRRD